MNDFAARGLVLGTAKMSEAAVARTRAYTLISIAGAVVLVLGFVIVQLRHGPWAAAVAFSLALFSLGYVLGLLFAVPKSAGPEALTAKATPRHLLLVNTSFEQISDWLTKIIVGVGLVQFNPILAFILSASKRIGAGFENPLLPAASAQVLALGIIIAFPALGLLLGFFSVRLYIARAIYVTDERAMGLRNNADDLRELDEAAMNNEPK